MSKLKLAFWSDLHLEFDGYKWKMPKVKADLLILAGDVGQGLLGVEWAIRQSERLRLPLVWVFGNHSFYNEDFSLIERAKEYCKNTNVHILEKDVFEISGYRILGTTMWTNYLLYGEPYQRVAMKAAWDFMADHRLIKYQDSIFTPDDALLEYDKSVEWLNKELQNTQKTIVITHHGITQKSIGLKYQGDMLSPAFVTDQSGFLSERYPLLWITAHTHSNYDGMINKTRVISNQRGYKNEGVAGFNPKLIVEV